MTPHSHSEQPANRGNASHPLATWRRHHGQCLRGALGRLIRRPVGAWATILVLGIVLSLPALVMTLGHQVERVGQLWMADAARMDVYLEPDASAKAREELADWLERQPTVEGLRAISPEAGLQTLALRLQIEGLDAMEPSPLPWVIELTLRDSRLETRLTLAEGLHQQPAVADFSAGGEWIERLEQVRGFFDEIGWWLLGLLGLTVIFVIGNTLRLELHERRREIAVVALIGGTERYMLRPLLYDGALTGLLGGAVAAGLVSAGLAMVSDPVQRFAASYGAAIEPATDPTLIGLLLAVGTFLGWLSAQLTGRYYITRLSTP